MKYHKIPKISRGTYIFQSLFCGAYIWRGLCTEGNLCFKIDWASSLLEGNLPFLLCFTLYLRANSKSKPPGAYIWRGDLMEGFFHYKVGGWGVLIFGEAYFQNFTVCAKMPQKPNYESKKIQILGKMG